MKFPSRNTEVRRFGWILEVPSAANEYRPRPDELNTQAGELPAHPAASTDSTLDMGLQQGAGDARGSG